MDIKGLTAAFCTLGCRVNQYETQAMAEDFIRHGFVVLPFSEKCDVYVINTCTVTAESDRKSRQMIHRAHAKNPDAVCVAVGCYTQTHPDEAFSTDGVDIISGSAGKSGICDKVIKYIEERKKAKISLVRDIFLEKEYEKMSITRSENTRAFVKIADGCENRCSYCIIPKARGRVRSRMIADILREIKVLAANGYREVVLTGIETASFGRDTKESLIDLLKEVNSVDGIERIRLGSLEPTLVTEEFARSTSSLSKVCPHFHLALQSGCDGVLFAMRRKYTSARFEKAVEYLRKYFPDVELTADVIVGFPNEDVEMFEESRLFIKKIGFEYIHIFPYSKREGTDAADMTELCTANEKKRRAEVLFDDMQAMRKSTLQKYDGKVFPVLLETKKDGKYSGYTPNYIETEILCDRDGLTGEIISTKLFLDEEKLILRGEYM